MDDLTLDQANAIIANKDPRGEAFWKNDKATVEAVQRAFETAHPGEAEMGNISPDLEKAMGETLDVKPAGSLGEPTSQEEYQAQVFDPLKVEWGADYEANAQAVGELLAGFPKDKLDELEASMTPEQIRQAVRLLSGVSKNQR